MWLGDRGHIRARKNSELKHEPQESRKPLPKSDEAHEPGDYVQAEVRRQGMQQRSLCRSMAQACPNPCDTF